ncbi:MAG: ABC transporter ATP-binding protein [Thermodesulfobacteriota bacterium]
MLRLENIEAFIGENQVLRGVSLEVPSGGSAAVLGANGAGKSSLIRVILGLLKVRSGRVLWQGREIQNLPPHQIARLGVACVPEGRRVFKDMSVLDNLKMGAYLPPNRAALARGLEEITAMFPVLGARLHQRAGTLSGGEQQMLAMGRALMSRPQLLLVDELSLGLAPLVVQEIYRALGKVSRGVTLLLVEQSVDQALRNSQQAYLLETGRVVRQGASAELMADASLKEAYLGM